MILLNNHFVAYSIEPLCSLEQPLCNNTNNNCSLATNSFIITLFDFIASINRLQLEVRALVSWIAISDSEDYR